MRDVVQKLCHAACPAFHTLYAVRSRFRGRQALSTAAYGTFALRKAYAYHAHGVVGWREKNVIMFRTWPLQSAYCVQRMQICMSAAPAVSHCAPCLSSSHSG